LRPANDLLFSWILSLGPRASHNLTASGLPEPDLRAMGIDTSFESFASVKDDHERRFSEEVARLYGTEPENVVATSGGSEAIFLVYSAFGEGRRALVPLPNYPAMLAVPRALGLHVVHNLKTAPRADTMVGLTDPNNPTGEPLSGDVFEDLAARWRKAGALVFLNETYKEFKFPRRPETAFDGRGGIVVCSTMTKFYGLGRLRVGWVMADKHAAQRVHFGKWAVSGHDSEYSLWIATQVLAKRRRFVEHAKDVVSRNRELVRRFISRTEGVSSELGVTPFCLVHYGKGPGSVAMAKRIFDETGVLVSPGDFFGAPKAFRLCFTADEKTLAAGLDRLSQFFNGL
jgi:aspartate/methionine/tyrosine aminotransferase